MIEINFNIVESRKRCLNYRKKILDISQQVTALHIAPAFSCVEIMDVIYNNRLKKSDIFLISKGHASILQYIILEEKGILNKNDIKSYCNGGKLGVHPDYGTPGIAASTGSLGHGLGLAVGMAYAKHLQERDSLVYVLLSDGECQEGSTWEAAMMAANLNLSNLIIFIDFNNFSGLDKISESHPVLHPILYKFWAFGWNGIQVNGHTANEILNAINERKKNKPFVVVCKTIKGKGVSFMENNPIWHYRSPSPEEYRQAYKELSDVIK